MLRLQSQMSQVCCNYTLWKACHASACVAPHLRSGHGPWTR